MAKKAIIEREKKRKSLIEKYFEKRMQLRQTFKQTDSFDEKFKIQHELQKLPRNSSPVRVHKRCILSGRPKGFYRYFGLSRHFLRELAHDGLLPGVRKASW